MAGVMPPGPSPSSQSGSLPDFSTGSYDKAVSGTAPVPIDRPISSRRDIDLTSSDGQKLDPMESGDPTIMPKPIHSSADKESQFRPPSSRSRSNTTFGRRKPRQSSDGQSAPSLKSSPSVPSIVVDEARPGSRMSERVRNGFRSRKSEDRQSSVPAVPPLPPLEPFQGITLDIPTSSFGDITSQLSRKDSVMNGKPNGIHANNSSNSLAAPPSRKESSRRVKSPNSLDPRPPSAASHAISVDDDFQSQKVRLMYQRGDENLSEAELKALDPNSGVLWEERSSIADDATDNTSIPGNNSTVDLQQDPSFSGSVDQTSKRSSAILREETELAGGIEDWDNVENEEVDRYGFIIPKREDGDTDGAPQQLQRVSTSLMLASSTPRRKWTLGGGGGGGGGQSSAGSIRSFSGRSITRKSTDQSNRPSTSQSSYQPSVARSTSSLRHAANRMPHNKNRRLKDEAADMLTLPESSTDTPENDKPYARAMKKKEWEREEKWRKMAKVASKPLDGSGMIFEFDTRSSKLIERTWKGIPDRWRATAWHAFLSASAKRAKDSPTEQELIRRFNELQGESSPDDVQIDTDVPRTISHHIMFRRRYRGGQRLLFRVLHAMSLYFPETGYVQGMATLAATLLAYFDEERAFVMLVRLWQLRGLDRLYRSGFAGLMEALETFEKEWLCKGEVAEKLSEIGIPPTAYGTRWYLTLFNYSIPFPAQLRVWDVFMLLGDSEVAAPKSGSRPVSSRSVNKQAVESQGPASPFGRSLDVLHATSAALIDGMRDIILESDFENAMKVLTSWVPIKDVELFMRVARAEWKVHNRKATS